MLNKNQGTFKRYEMKYQLSESKYEQLMEELKGKLETDSYGEVDICNIYFDTPNKLLIRNSLEKPIYKEKLRLRSYGVPKDSDSVFVELKKKYDGIVYKRRIKLELLEAEAYLYDKKEVNIKTSQIKREIDWFIQHYERISGRIEPSMYISYRRTAMFGVDDNELRVTFDRNIRWREENLFLESGIFGEELLDEGVRLMEIKIHGAMPLWLSNTLDRLEIYPSSYSKYGKAYEASNQKGLQKEYRNEFEIQNKGVVKYA